LSSCCISWRCERLAFSPQEGSEIPYFADFLRQRIANYKIPKYFSIETELPKLPNYKIDKVTLQSRVAGPSRLGGENTQVLANQSASFVGRTR